jgi:lipopolysaccharide transport system permease protein
MMKPEHNTDSSSTSVIMPKTRLGWPDFGELWRFRELLLVLTVRDIKVRYKRASIGVAWAFLQPFLTLVVFTLIFGKLANIPSEGLPYAVFAMAGLLPWQLFSRGLTQASSSLVSMQGMMTKTYFPRLIAPLSEILACLPDFFISLVLLAGVMTWYGVVPGYAVFLLPLLILLAVITSLSLALWLAALNIEYRDVQFALPFLAQLWMYATPVVYSLTSVPEQWRWLVVLNPMTAVVEGFRWGLSGKPWILSPIDFLISAVSVVFFLVTGLRYFDKVQRTFADRV